MVATLSSKDRREFLSTIFYCSVDGIADLFLLVRMMRRLKGSERLAIPPEECNETLRDNMLHTLKSRFRLLRKRGRLLDVIHSGYRIQVWERNEHKFKYLPVHTRYVKDGDETIWLKRYLYKKDFKVISR